ncbi:hypothetical protein BN381_260002 [Candidatus Microthrix parvicella RN1]|uniref:Core-binding (CB) domain-containing protein n=1 Tax=Candidatus Neomicrothrix parvicella RN1 TaxID=1229780 RepID=R4YYH4_9ACTN|nr:hypothetical protein BN381_260002 [Candidatus Microthrix parvicella RN1]
MGMLGATLENVAGRRCAVSAHGLRVITGAAVAAASPLDADAFQAVCVEGFVASWTARGFSPITIENHTGVLERFLGLLEIPAWEARPEDVDRVRSGVGGSWCGGVDTARLCAGVQGLPPVSGGSQGCGDRGHVRRDP